MPIYCYASADGRVVEQMFPMGKQPDSIEVEGEILDRAYGAEGKGGFRPGNWPMVSNIAFGFDADQMAEVRAQDHANGLGTTDYVKGEDGTFAPEFTSPNHRKAYCESQNMFDRNAGCNDPLPQERT
jgi:hypothetical protein